MADINWGQFNAGYDPAQFAQQQNQDRLLRQNEAKARQEAIEFQAKQTARAAAQVRYDKAAELYRKGDQRGAEAEFMAAGDKDMLTGTTSAGKEQFDQRQAGLQGVGGFAKYVMEHISDPEVRKAVIAHNKPLLVAAGARPEDVDVVVNDPSDAVLGGVASQYYSPKDQDAARVAQQGANTADMNAETARLTANNPVVVGGSLVTRGGQELFRAPEYINAPTGNNVYQVGGTQAEGYTGGPITAEQLYQLAIEPQESGGRAGVLGPMTRYGQAQGASQMLPATARGVAKNLGIAWRPDLMTAKTPEGLAYQRQLGIGYAQEALDATGGDPRAAAMYYHGGPDRGIWGDKTKAYGQAIVGRLEKARGVTATSRTPQLVQAGQAKPDAASSSALKPKDLQAAKTRRSQAVQIIDLVNRQRQLENSGKLTTGWLGGGYGGSASAALNDEDAEYDANNARLTQMTQGLTRIPGIGSQSDYDAKLAAAAIPTRAQRHTGRSASYNNIARIAQDTIADLDQITGGNYGAPAAQKPAQQASGGRKPPPVGFRTKTPGGKLVEWTGSTWRQVG
jgi:hypothetical protein